MRRLPSGFGENILLALVAFSILWRGGKSVDATFLLAIVVSIFVLVRTFGELRTKNQDTRCKMQMAPWILFFSFLLWSILAFLQSTAKNYGLDEILRDAAFFLVFVSVARTSPERITDTWRNLASVVAIAGALAVIVGIAVYAWQPVDRFVGTFFDARFHTDYWPNAWAEFVLLAWPLTFALLLRASSPLYRSSLIVVLGMLLGSLFLSFSRGAFLALCGQIVLLGLLFIGLRLRKMRLPFAAPVIIMLISTLLGVTLFTGANALRARQFTVQSVTDKATFTASEGTSSVNERKDFWNHALELGMQRPVFGWGPYSFRFVQPRLANGVLQTSDHPHNVFLKIFMERGLPAALLFAVFLFLILLRTLRSFYASTIDETRIFSVLGVVAVGGVIAHNLIDYNLQFVGIALPFWIVLGLLAAALPRSKKMYGAPIEAIIALVLVCIVMVEGGYLVLSSLGRHAEAVGETDVALSWYEKASGEIFSRDMLLSRSQLLFGEKLYDQGSAVLDVYQKMNTEDPRVWEMRGWQLLARNDPANASVAFTKAYESGKWLNVGVLHGLLEARRGERKSLSPEEYRDYETTAKAYGRAILENAHFIALSTNVREFASVAALLPYMCPLSPDECASSAMELDVLSIGAQLHAEEEQGKYSARPSGYLW